MKLNSFEQILALIPGNVYWKGKDGKFLGCNNNVAKILGLKSPIEILGKTNFDLFPYLLAEKTTQNDEEVFQTGKPFISEEKGVSIDGKPIIYHSEKWPLFSLDHQIIGLVGISIDITERKKFEERIQKERRKAEAANIAKSKFLANLSHDIRTPISSLVSLTESFYKENEVQDNKIKASLAYHCACELLKLIDEILEFLEVDNVELVPKKLESFSLCQLLEKTISLVITAAYEKKLEISFFIEKGTPKKIYSYGPLIYRILLNLVNNAIKFTHQGKVEILLKPIKFGKRNITLQLSVIDTGIGIAEEEQEKIFNKFYRLEPSYNGQQSGYGLGLYIVKQYAEALNATLTLQSELGQGSTFTLIFDVIVDEEQGIEEENVIRYFHYDKLDKYADVKLINQHSQLDHETSSKLHKLLLVEDSISAQHAIKSVFKTLPVRVDIASYGEEAMHYIKQNLYDLIIIDLGLPDCYGTELSQRIRNFQKQTYNKVTPIIALTAHARPQDLLSCYESGIQQVLRKPLQVEQAEVLLKNWIEFDSFINHHTNLEINSSIDVEKAKELMGGNLNLVREIYEGFVKDLTLQQKEIIELYESNNLEQFKDKIHYINGCASYLGANKLRMICNSLEVAIIDELDKELICELLYNDFLQEVKSLISEYKKLQTEKVL